MCHEHRQGNKHQSAAKAKPSHGCRTKASYAEHSCEGDGIAPTFGEECRDRLGIVAVPPIILGRGDRFASRWQGFDGHELGFLCQAKVYFLAVSSSPARADSSSWLSDLEKLALLQGENCTHP